MEPAPMISVVLATYNRQARLERALRALFACDPPDRGAEIVVVDNNSSDGTRDWIASIAGTHPGLRYLFEPRQGVAYARNRGIAESRGEVVAFTDDDQDVSRDWLRTIERAFHERPEVGFVAGKVLPRWPGRPPAWLDLPLWGAVGLVDPGDESLPLDAEHPRNVRAVGAGNLALRRGLAERELFDPRFQRVRDSIGSSEDWEMLIRLCRRGVRGLYLPSLVAWSDVDPVRLTRRYHRRWQYGHGGYRARMGIEKPDGGFLLFGVPGWYYRESLDYVRKWLQCARRGEDGPGAAFEHQLHAIRAAGYIRQAWRMQPRGSRWRDVLRVGAELSRRTLAGVRRRAARRS